MDRYSLFVDELPSPLAGEVWFLVKGVLIGSAHRTLRARVYSFDGTTFETVWAPPDHLQGEITVEGNIITLRSLDREQYFHVRQPPYGRVERFALTPQGVEQLSSVLDIK